jgi:hypothetical protein
MTIEAMNLALEALETEQGAHAYLQLGKADHIEEAIDGLRTAIEAAEKQEPVAWRNAAIRLGEELSSVGPDGYYNMTAEQWLDWAMDQHPQGKNSLTTPPAAQRQPLTDEQIKALFPSPDGSAEADVVKVEVSPGIWGTEYSEIDAWSYPLVLQVARAIEAAHGITKEKPDAA